MKVNLPNHKYVIYERDIVDILIAFNDGINSCGLLGVIEEINSSTIIVQIELVNSSGYMIEPYTDGCP